MKLEDYEKEGRAAYEDLARTIRSIIETVGQRSTDYRIQQVQCRAKGVKSLRAKLDVNGALGSDEIENVVKDLAGCRVILYTNADVARFIYSGIISDNFEVNWDRTKFHYPSAEPTAEDGFISYNYVVRLKPDRSSLAEYAPFSGMWCEVQVQTTLDHAWSEMAHDTIYKPPPPGLGETVMNGVAERMTEIMQKYLRPAGFEFQKIVADVRALEKAREVLAADPLNRLRQAEDNNVRHEILREFKEHVLPYYDDPSAVADDIRKTMVDAALAARAAPARPWEALGHSFDGVEAGRVVDAALEVVLAFRFASLDAIHATFAAIAELFPDASGEERASLDRAVESLAKHDMRLWQTAGPIVPKQLVAGIAALLAAEREPIRPLIVKTLGHILKSDVTGVSSTYNAFTLHQGAVVASHEFLSIRRDAISVLEELFASTSGIGEQFEILYAFECAGRTPNQGQLTAGLYQATLDDTARIVKFLTDRAAHLAYEFLQKAEHDLLWRYRHTSALPPMFAENVELEESRQSLREAILSFRDRINADREFSIYKTLVGFESVFPMAWSNSSSDYMAEASYRAAEIERLAGEVDETTFDSWLRIIRRCAQTKSNDGATFPSFREFLIKLGQANPIVLIKLFDHLDGDLDWFVADMLLGLEGGPLAGQIVTRTTAWVDERRHLAQVASYCVRSKRLDEPMLRSTVAGAIEADEQTALGVAMGSCVRRDSEAAGGLTDLFAAAVSHFVAKKSIGWTNSVWFHADVTQFVQRLPSTVKKSMLDNLLHLRSIDFHAEELLNAIARDAPADLLQFFRARFKREATEGEEPAGYEAIPFDFHRLSEVFAAHGAEVVAAVRIWFDDEDDALFEYRGGAFIARLYPDFTGPYGPLLALARDGEDKDTQFVLRVLSSYKGEVFIIPVCRELVARMGADNRLLSQVDLVLDQSGVVHGEYGFAELYQRRKDEVTPWLTDPNPAVQAYAGHRLRQLDLRVAAEQRRAREGVELSKRRYGE